MRLSERIDYLRHSLYQENDSNPFEELIHMGISEDDVYWSYYFMMKLYPPNNENIQNKINKKRNDYLFRKNVSTLYQNKCAISSADMEQCQISHIKPFSISSDEEKYNMYNGWILSSELHQCFDKYLFSVQFINNEFKIIVSNKAIDKQLSIVKYNHMILNIHPLSKPFFEYHFSIFSQQHLSNL
jgi:hypothetical protein